MSLTMLLRNPEGIVMAADSRVTTGFTLKGPKTSDDSIKFIQLNMDLGVMTHGIFDIGNMGINALKAEIDSDSNQNFFGPEFMDKGRQIFKEVDNKWTNKNPDVQRKDNDTGFIIGGLDRHDMLFKAYVFESPEFTPKIITSNFFLAGQWHISRFLLTKLDREKISIDSLKNLAAITLLATSKVDKTVGGPLHLATITESKGFQWASDKEIKSILDFNSLFCDFFRELLESSLAAVLNK